MSAGPNGRLTIVRRVCLWFASNGGMNVFNRDCVPYLGFSYKSKEKRFSGSPTSTPASPLACGGRESWGPEPWEP